MPLALGASVAVAAVAAGGDSTDAQSQELDPQKRYALVAEIQKKLEGLKREQVL